MPAPTAARVPREYDWSKLESEKTVAVAPATPIFDFCAGESSRVPAWIVKVDLVQSLLQDQVLFPQGIKALLAFRVPSCDVSRSALRGFEAVELTWAVGRARWRLPSCICTRSTYDNQISQTEAIGKTVRWRTIGLGVAACRMGASMASSTVERLSLPVGVPARLSPCNCYHYRYKGQGLKEDRPRIEHTCISRIESLRRSTKEGVEAYA